MNALLLSHDFSQPKAAPVSALPSPMPRRQDGSERKNGAPREERPARITNRRGEAENIPHYFHGGLNE
jgi:hypothetical protein